MLEGGIEHPEHILIHFRIRLAINNVGIRGPLLQVGSRAKTCALTNR